MTMKCRVKHLKFLVYVLSSCVGLLLFCLPQPLYAGIYDADTPVTYKEYWVNHNQFDGGCPPNNPVQNADRWYIEPKKTVCVKTVTFNIPDNFTNALKAEIYLDLWRNHDERTARFSLNGAAERQPNVGWDWSRSPYVAQIPFSELRQGTNTIVFSSDGSARLHHIHDIAIRIYYTADKPLNPGINSDVTPPTAALVSISADNGPFAPTDGGTLTVNNNQVTLSATASDATLIEFHGFYEGYDLDTDGNFREWQNRSRHNCNPGGSTFASGCSGAKPAIGGTIDHIGTTGPLGTFSNCSWNAGTSTATCVWDLSHVTNQSGVRFKVRALDAAGNVLDAGGGASAEFTLLRHNPTAAFLNPTFQDQVIHADGTAPKTITTTVALPANTASYNVAYLMGSYFQNPKIYLNTRQIRPFTQGSTLPKDDTWTLSVQQVPEYRVYPGNNNILYEYSSSWGQFVERPGPMIVLRRSGSPITDNVPPATANLQPAPNAQNVHPTQAIKLNITDDLGVGVDYTSIKVRVNGSLVSPKIQGFSNNYTVSYVPNDGFPNSTDIAVVIEAQDLLGNTMTPLTFSFRIEDPDLDAPVISSMQVITGFTQATISWITDEPATSVVQYGLSSPTQNTLSASELITTHQVVVTGLTPDTLYQFIVKSADDDGNIAATPPATFRTALRIPAVSDDFNYCNMTDPRWAKWQFVNPKNDATYSLNGEELVINVPGGVEHDIWSNGNPIIRAPHFLQNANDPNVIQAKFTSSPTAAVEQQGILAIQDANNFMRFNFQYNANTGQIEMFVVRVRSGAAKVIFSSPVDMTNSNGALYMSILRGEDNRWRPRYSVNGVNWTVLGSLREAFSITQIGLYAGNAANGGSPPPAFTAKVDYFFNDESPINPEDPIAQLLPVTANPADKGSVTKSVACGNPVTLTATAVPGWSFSSWSGAATGAVNPIAVSFGAGDFVVANFTQDQYTFTAKTVGSGSVSHTPENGPYLYGNLITLQATPTLGWSFAGWSGDVAGSTNPTNLAMTSSKVVTTTFTQDQYTLSATPSDPLGGTVMVSPQQQTYIYNEQVTLVATATPGWTFVGWSGGAAGVQNPLVVTMTGNQSVVAIFTKDQYTLASNAVGNGTVNRNPDKSTYDFGDQVMLTASAETGWKLDRWEGGVTGSLNPSTLTMNANTTVTAIFTKTRHTLTNAVIGNGSLIINPDKPFYFYGDEVTVTVLPATGWTLDGWSGDATGRDNPITLVMNGNKAVVARFVEAPHLLTTTTTGQGTITRSPNLQSFKEGDTVALTALPAPGWRFAEWSGAATGTANPVTITMNDNKTVSANFTRIGYTVAVAVASTVNNTNPAGNTATVNPTQALYNYGDAVTLTAVAAEGWTFAGWQGDFTGLATSAQLTVATDLNITALFTPTLYELNIAGGLNSEGGEVTVSKAAPYTHGEVITLTAVPADGYGFAEWLIDGAQVANASVEASELTVTIPDNRIFSARFQKLEVLAEQQIFLPFVSR